MSEKVLYLKGEAAGYFKPKVWNQSGVYSFYNIDIQTINIKNTQVLEPVNFSELKIDLYNQPTVTKQLVNVFIDDTNYIQENVNDILFTEILLGESITINNEKFIKYEATAYFKLLQIIPDAKIVNTSATNNILKKYTPLDFIFPPKKVPGDQPHTEPEKTAKQNTFWNAILGSLVIGVVGFFLLKLLFGLSFLTFFLPIIFFLKMLFGSLINRYPYLQNTIGVKNTFLNQIGWILLIIGLFLLFKSFSFNTSLLLILFGVSLILLSRNGLWVKWLGRLGFIISCVFLFGLCKSLFQNFKSNNSDDRNNRTSYDDTNNRKWDYSPEETKDTIRTDANDTLLISYLTHRLNWDDNYHNNYSGVFAVKKDHFNIVRLKRNQIEPTTSDFRQYYNQVYINLVKQNQNYLDSVVKTYSQIGKKNNLNDKLFADMIVTSVQNIPYCMVHDFSHKESDEKYGGFIREYHQTGKPCLEKIKFGLQAPAEFISNLKGDCDTRSLFLYYILSKLGFSSVVLGSEYYSHAILGISGNYSGDYIKYDQLKYYVWETTATGFTPGNISPTVNNLRYWSVVLGNNK